VGSGHDKWQIRPLDGKFITLGDLAGKVVFLNFWSTSCGPCIAEMPGIEKLRDSLKGEQIAFVVVTEDDEPRVRSFLKKVPLDLPVYLTEAKPPQDLQVMGFPTTFILDRKGAAVYREVGGYNWDNDSARGFLRGLATQ
jgi:thiol-disulfide isomerase/thioredoxin